MAIAEGLAAAKLALEVSRTAIDLVRRPKPDGEKIRATLIELQDLVHSAQQALGEADEENRELNRQLANKQAFETVQVDMEYQQDGEFYIRKSERDAGNVIPYCPICWKDNDKTIPLKSNGEGSYDCVKHNVSFHTTARLKAVRDAVERYNNRPIRRRR